MKSNLVPPEPLSPGIREAEKRRYFLSMIELWRIFDLYLDGLTEARP
jgi:hypothetical protein